jgi:hypothetical protein
MPASCGAIRSASTTRASSATPRAASWNGTNDAGRRSAGVFSDITPVDSAGAATLARRRRDMAAQADFVFHRIA